VEINAELLEHALDGLGLLEPDAEGELGALGAEGHAARPDIRPPDPVLSTITWLAKGLYRRNVNPIEDFALLRQVLRIQKDLFGIRIIFLEHIEFGSDRRTQES